MNMELRDREHLFRAAALLLGGVVVFLLIREAFVPESFGALGHYRAAALDDVRAQEPVFAGQAACAECHDDVLVLKAAGPHQGIHCEACHGALGKHATDPDALTPERPPGRDTCLRCHQPNLAKPAGFPQVDADEHAGDEDCVACHTPHQPQVE